ncbi:LysR substrate-binding domain-containing protein [Neisseriaceae bacterium ESL0693]|nr:LysR substrate-binding domain-containing protein [Neisseriaceae bacterium ESL0693]
MDTLQSLRVFRYVVELGSFTKAAEYLDISTAMASKHIHHLENIIQAKVLNRTSRHISLTETGKTYYQHCVEALNTLNEANHIAQTGNLKPQGLLKVTMPAWCATPYLAQLLSTYQQQYPEVTLSLHLDSRHTDLVAEGMDMALRVTNHPEPHLIVRPLTTIGFVWVASPRYLQTHGIPENHEELNHHYGLLPSYAPMSLPFKPAVYSNNALMLHQLALNHTGVAYLPSWLIKEDIKEHRLQVINDNIDNHTLYAAYMNREFLSAKVRSLIDFLADSFKASPA